VSGETAEQAASILEEGAAALDALLGRLDEAAGGARGTIGGGAWSARDLVGHIETWEQVALDTVEDVLAGRPPRIRQVVTDMASLDRFNAAEVERKAARGWAEALASFHKTHDRLLRTIRGLGPDEWGRRPAGREEGEAARTLGEEVGSSLGAPGKPFRHVWAHLDDLAAFVAVAEGRPADSQP
jgi:hypothetical protein